jgi:hypothetical protein
MTRRTRAARAFCDRSRRTRQLLPRCKTEHHPDQTHPFQQPQGKSGLWPRSVAGLKSDPDLRLIHALVLDPHQPYDGQTQTPSGSHAMNILILGSGGREHALTWAVKQNPKVDRLIVAPGNGGIAMLAECADIDILDGATVVTFCEENAIDFVIRYRRRHPGGGHPDLWAVRRRRTARGVQSLHQGYLRLLRGPYGRLGAIYRPHRSQVLYPRSGRTHCRQGRRVGCR